MRDTGDESRRAKTMSETHRGFILQPTYRIASGRPVIHLYGRLESGETFLVRDGRMRPFFYVEAGQAERVRALAGLRVEASRRVTLCGRRPVSRVELAIPQDTPAVREQLERAGIECHEADVRFAMRYLIDRGIRGALEIRGISRPGGRGIERVFVDPEVGPAEFSPKLSVLSLDLETDPNGRRIYSAALAGCGVSEVILVSPAGATRPASAQAVASEAELLRLLVRRVRELDPDVLTGWNVADFDFAVLLRRSEELGVALALGRVAGRIRRIEGRRERRQVTQVQVPGRLVLDGLHLLRGAFVRMEQYSLGAVAREVLGQGKLLSGKGRAQEITRWFREDRERLVAYNRRDAELVIEILARLELVELAVERSRLTGLPLDRVSASVAAFDFLYLSELGRRGVVAPSVRQVEDFAPMSGGHVLKPKPGLYRNVVVLDFKSLYPSLIRTFQIDPLGYLGEEEGEDGEAVVDAIAAPSGARFRREPGILTGLLDELFPKRAAAQQRGDAVASYAIKILMNSFYGVLGTTVCRFFDPRIANAITSFGKEILLWCRDRIEARGHEVLYGDTDSLFVLAGLAEAAEAQGLGASLAAELNAELTAFVAERWRVESRLEIQLERLYLRLYLPPLRHRREGAMKRYAGLIERAGQQEVVFTGLEAVRTDWTELARNIQRELFERLFHEQPVAEYLEQRVADLRAGRLDDLLVYRKGLRKEPAAYTKATPPHVAAARLMSGPPGSVVAYVMTIAGPEPAEERQHAYDYEHYVDKQVRPIAEPVLELLGLRFEAVVGDEHQIELF